MIIALALFLFGGAIGWRFLTRKEPDGFEAEIASIAHANISARPDRKFREAK